MKKLGETQTSLNETLKQYFMSRQKDPDNADTIGMNQELLRFASFANFPLDIPIHATRLAAAGFYYQGNEDEVICFSCGIKHRGWKEGDIPLDIHTTISPHCDFLKTNRSGNIDTKAQEWKPDVSNGEDSHTHENAVTKEQHTKESTQVNNNDIQSIQVTGACGGPQDNETFSTRNVHSTDEIRSQVQSSPIQPHVGQRDRNNATNFENEDRVSPALSGLSSQQHRGTPKKTGNNEFNFVSASHNKTSPGLSCNETSNVRPQSTEANQRPTPFELEPLGISVQSPVHQQYAMKVTRLSSFSTWPEHITQRPEDLAKSGLFYEGVGDRVRCFFCGGGLFNWDSKDDPWIEHARWYPKCVFLRQSKGDEFIYKVQVEVAKGCENFSHLKDTQPSNQNRKTTTSATTADMLSHPAAQSVLEMGLNSALVKKALQILLSNGKNHLTAEKLLVKVWELEESGTAESSDTNHESTEGNEEEKLEAAVGDSSSTCEHKSNTDDKINNEAERIAVMEENRYLRELQLCKICLDEDISIVFLPCGHMAACASCAPALRKCPICRTFIKGTVKAIIS